MSDIVDRLKAAADIVEVAHGRVAGAACLETEAADEIERLQAVVDEYACDAAARVLRGENG